MREDAIRRLKNAAIEQGWSRQKLKSLRGQMLNLPEEEREAFLQRLMKKGESRR